MAFNLTKFFASKTFRSFISWATSPEPKMNRKWKILVENIAHPRKNYISLLMYFIIHGLQDPLSSVISEEAKHNSRKVKVTMIK